MLVTINKEVEDSISLAEMLAKDPWIDSDVILVNCSPDYSSLMCQVVNHRLSRKNGHELFEQLPMEMPYPTMNQVWNKETICYETFDSYLREWIIRYVSKDYKYLFLDSGTIRGKNFSKVKTLTKDRAECRFGCLYLQDDSIFTPDYFVEKFSFNNQGGLIFEWENPKNPNWNY